MTTFTATVGDDSVLHLDVPMGTELAGRVVDVTLRPVPQPMTQEEWHALVARTAGGWGDEEFERPPQGGLPVRDFP